MMGTLAYLIKPEKESQFGLSDDADPDRGCSGFILKDEEN